jgi:hypothetical protein
MQIEKKNKGSQYFFSGILNFQKGIKQINTISEQGKRCQIEM